MKNLITFVLLLFLVPLQSQMHQNYNVDGTNREAILYEPAVKNSGKIPVVFVFHGHGGNANFASKRMDFQHSFKEALVIFMQGIPGTSGYIIDKKGLKNGWQIFPNENQNRDVRFFDEVLKQIKKKYSIDENRIFVAGHSNGARFVNILWVERGSVLAGIISVSAQGGRMIEGAKTVSVWMSMGKNDPLVPYQSQAQSIPIVKNILKTDEKSVQTVADCKIYKGINNTELVVQERNAGHEFPKEDVPEMVAFLQRQVRN